MNKLANELEKIAILLSSEEETLFNIDNVNGVKKEIYDGLKQIVPFVNIIHSTLGGKDRVSILFTISLDDKSEWTNNILQNSRYVMFHLLNNGSLEAHNKSYKIDKKFRKTKTKSIQDVVNKVKKYIQEIKQS